MIVKICNTHNSETKFVDGQKVLADLASRDFFISDKEKKLNLRQGRWNCAKRKFFLVVWTTQFNNFNDLSLLTEILLYF